MRIPALVALLALLSACANAPYRPAPLDISGLSARAEAQASERFDVRAAVPGENETIGLFDVDMYARGVQPVWLEVTNRSEHRARAIISSIDRRYFPPAEVAWYFKGDYSREGWLALEERLLELSFPRRVPPGATVSGFVFTNREPGTKAFNLDLYHGTLPPTYDEFTFFLTVPGFVPDYASVRFRDLYPEDEHEYLTLADLHDTLAAMDCCSVAQDGAALGRPVNVFFVADPFHLLRALFRAGWSEASYVRDEAYLESAHHLYGRPADGLFRKARDASSDRAELGVWRTPLFVEDVPVWAAQYRHAIGRRFPIGERLFGVRIDPDVTDGRNYLLQNIWYGQAVERWGLVPGNASAPPDDPAMDFLGNPWFVRDDQRIVIWISDDPVSMVEARQVTWPVTGVDGEVSP